MKYRSKNQLSEQAKFDRLINKIKDKEAIDLNGKKVSIKMDDYSKRIRNGELGGTFTDWLEKNSHRQFVAVASTNSTMPNMYDLILDGEKVEPWVFSWFDLRVL